MTLNDLKQGEQATILEVQDTQESGILVNLGLQTGVEIEVIWEGVLYRPMVIKHSENQLIAIRDDVARRVIVEKIK